MAFEPARPEPARKAAFLTIRQALAQGRNLLEQAGIAAPRLTAELLLGQAVFVPDPAGFRPDAAWFYAHSDRELREVEWIHYGRYLHQRLGGRPTQYITGRQEFYGREFRVTPAVLIPRPETELLVETALRDGSGKGNAIDIGTGSGAIATTLALEGWTGPVVGVDISPAALAVARTNADRLAAPVSFLQCDLLAAAADSCADLIVSNPPYVAETDRAGMQREVVDFEPALALFAGPDGLAVYRRLIPEARRALKPGGLLALEIGMSQAPAITQLLEGWSMVRVRNDLAGIGRVVTATKPA